MDFLYLSFIALGLAMDAFAVSISCGLSLDRFQVRSLFRIAFTFGFFQAAMPVLGWGVGFQFRGLIGGMDHWVALVILTGVGGHMIRKSWHHTPCSKPNNPLRWPVLLSMGLATSVDALAVGLTFAFLGVRLLTTVLYIGIVTFVISGIGLFLGSRFGMCYQKMGERIGGLILIGIGLKIFCEHLIGGL